MLFKFKSRATADLIMLEPNGRRVLEIIGKNPDDAHGIVTAEQIPAAIAALEAAVRADDAARAGGFFRRLCGLADEDLLPHGGVERGAGRVHLQRTANAQRRQEGLAFLAAFGRPT